MEESQGKKAPSIRPHTLWYHALLLEGSLKRRISLDSWHFLVTRMLRPQNTFFFFLWFSIENHEVQKKLLLTCCVDLFNKYLLNVAACQELAKVQETLQWADVTAAPEKLEVSVKASKPGVMLELSIWFSPSFFFSFFLPFFFILSPASS